MTFRKQWKALFPFGQTQNMYVEHCAPYTKITNRYVTWNDTCTLYTCMSCEDKVPYNSVLGHKNRVLWFCNLNNTKFVVNSYLHFNSMIFGLDIKSSLTVFRAIQENSVMLAYEEFQLSSKFYKCINHRNRFLHLSNICHNLHEYTNT